MKLGFGERIRSEMNAQGLSEVLLSKELGAANSTFNNWINERSEPKFSTLCAIGEELELNLHWILTGEGPMEPPTNSEPPTVSSIQPACGRATSPEGGAFSPSGAFTTPHNMSGQTKALARQDRDRRMRLAATVARNKQRQEDLEIIRKIEAMTKEFRAYSNSRPTLTEHPKGGDGAGLTERHESPVSIQRRLFLTLVEAVFWLLSGIGFWTVVDLIWEALK